MSDRLETRNGESVTIDSVLEVLERTPSKEEVVAALKSLRHDKVKNALDETVKAAKFDLERVFEEFLQDGEKAERTVETYRREIGRLLTWLERESLHIFQVQRADVNRFKSYLSGKYSANTVRLTLSASSAFYGYLEAERYVDRTPFAHIKYPKKHYKKAVKPDQGSPVPVMSEKEYLAIMEALERKTQTAGDMVYERASRESASRLLPIVHFMGTYGLRIGDVLTVKLEGKDRFSYRQKGDQVRQKNLRPITQEILSGSEMHKRRPFRGIAKSTVQGAIGRLTRELAGRGTIRHAYSCHDFRHHRAVKLYGETRDVYAVKEALGHATVSVTEIYLAGLGVAARYAKDSI
ncbi:MAG: phage integrase N-terminal SAM-like domain-containing protein [Planctomycetota bacterium]|jgi:site-specific recombinase XerD|nr:phage integrase N-terminal SAM-like domain-containing protein [Planctomycetota bacterium]